MAGYPGSPLPKTLGIKPGHHVVLLNAPATFERALAIPDDVRVTYSIKAPAPEKTLPPVDIVVCFADGLEALEKKFSLIASRLHPHGGFWVAWPLRRAKDISEDVVRRVGLAAGMVDNKVCVIGGTWLAVRLVIRAEFRDAVLYRTLPPVSSLGRARRPSAAVRLATRVQGGGSTLRRARARSSR